MFLFGCIIINSNNYSLSDVYKLRMFSRSVNVTILCLIFFLVLVSAVQAGELTCRSNLTYASDYYTCGGDLVDNNKYEEVV